MLVAVVALVEVVAVLLLMLNDEQAKVRMAVVVALVQAVALVVVVMLNDKRVGVSTVVRYSALLCINIFRYSVCNISV